MGLATAFVRSSPPSPSPFSSSPLLSQEDWDKNTVENLRSFLSSGELTGATLASFRRYKKLEENETKLRHLKLNFPIAQDKIEPMGEMSDDEVLAWIEKNVPHYQMMLSTAMMERVREVCRHSN